MLISNCEDLRANAGPVRRLVKKQSRVSLSQIAQGDGLDKPTDRDQRSWVFLNYPKNTLPLTEHPKRPEKQNPKKYPQERYSFG